MSYDLLICPGHILFGVWCLWNCSWQFYQLQKHLFVLNMISMAIKGINGDLPLIVRIDAFSKAEKRQLEYESHIFLTCDFWTLFPLLFILLSLTIFSSILSLLLVSFDWSQCIFCLSAVYLYWNDNFGVFSIIILKMCKTGSWWILQWSWSDIKMSCPFL